MVGIEPSPCIYLPTRFLSQDITGRHPWQTGVLVGEGLTPLQGVVSIFYSSSRHYKVLIEYFLGRVKDIYEMVCQVC